MAKCIMERLNFFCYFNTHVLFILGDLRSFGIKNAWINVWINNSMHCYK